MHFPATRYPDTTTSANSRISFRNILPVGDFHYAFLLTFKGILLLLLIQITPGCRHITNSEIKPTLVPPAGFSQVWKNPLPETEWWKSFQDPFLDKVIEKAFRSSFTLKQASARIMQSRLAAGQSASELYPEVTGDVSGNSEWYSDGTQQKSYRAKISISWELDLWDKLSSAEKALHFEAESVADDYQAAAFLLSALIAENYLQLVEQNLQIELLERQLAASSTFLELIELRFANGDASVVDIYQQRQQLASIRTQLPRVKKQSLLLNNRLAVLAGALPGGGQTEISDHLPELSRKPDTGIPADLLLNRPDLRSIHKELLATDQTIAEAVADRLPGIKLTGSGGYSGSSFSADNFLVSILGNLFIPIFDWQKRIQEVSKRQYQLDELLAKYSHAFLVAIEETENGIWEEKYQAELINSLNDHLQIAEANLVETRNRYMQGLTDYLPVLTALQSVQQLEREMLSQSRQLLVTRVRLHRALGGADFAIVPVKEEP